MFVFFSWVLGGGVGCNSYGKRMIIFSIQNELFTNILIEIVCMFKSNIRVGLHVDLWNFSLVLEISWGLFYSLTVSFFPSKL